MVINFKLREDSLHNKQLCHYINGRSLRGPFPTNLDTAMFGMGCFWGVEKVFWTRKGVWVTAVGYSGGDTENPTYQEVCSGRTNHNEVVFIKYDPKLLIIICIFLIPMPFLYTSFGLFSLSLPALPSPPTHLE